MNNSYSFKATNETWITKKYLHEQCLYLRFLVENVHDTFFIINENNCWERTKEGEILSKVLLGLDMLRSVIDSELSNEEMTTYSGDIIIADNVSPEELKSNQKT